MKYYFFGLGTMMAVCVGCYVPSGGHSIEENKYVAPPAAMMQRPGPMVDGPGPGVMPMLSHPPARSFATKTTQLRFVEPKAMQIGWRIRDGYAENQITAPGRYNFSQGATYRLKISDVPGREGLTLYPTLQVYPGHPTTDAYLSHNSIPIALTTEDLNQVESNNFVTKVIYLPDAKNQELAIAGVETIVSTRLDPGVDPVAEADRRGTIMVVLRLGNMNLEMPGADLDMTGLDASGNISQVVHLNGMQGQTAPPMPIAESGVGLHGVPNPMIASGGGLPGQPSMDGMVPWGMPITATPIGLPGPPHLPLGGPAGLQSHTIRNKTSVDIGKPVDHLLIDVEHDPGYRLPHPVKHIQYKETHPNFAPGATTYPNWAVPQGIPQR